MEGSKFSLLLNMSSISLEKVTLAVSLSSIPEHEFSFVVRDPLKIIHIPYLSHSVVFIRNRGL